MQTGLATSYDYGLGRIHIADEKTVVHVKRFDLLTSLLELEFR